MRVAEVVVAEKIAWKSAADAPWASSATSTFLDHLAMDVLRPRCELDQGSIDLRLAP